MHWVYIIYSKELDIYYIGETSDINRRIKWHNKQKFSSSFTAQSTHWDLFYQIECRNIIQARKIEKHIKSMKSRVYIKNLKTYPEITLKLLERFK